jgi:tetraacyldisaccharide 4'-kinase
MKAAWLRDAWDRKGGRGKLYWLALLPLSSVYRLIVAVRNSLFSVGWLKAKSLDRPVISVGNLTVGGTGKTPTCIWLAQELQKRGVCSAILSRGYRRSQAGGVIVRPQNEGAVFSGDANEIAAAGDEPFMMARLYRQTVAVGKDRWRAARQLLTERRADVFILDDGFQHRQLKRDLDLLLLGSDTSGTVLPAGPFREPLACARRADYLLVTGGDARWRAVLDGLDGTPLFFGSLRPIGLGCIEANRWVEYPLSVLFNSRILAVAGIANPESFYRTLHEAGGEIADTIAYEDHHAYSSRDWQEINRAGRNVDLIVTTEKDLVKLGRFPFPRGKFLALRVAMQVEDGEKLIDQVLERLQVKPQ